MSYQPTSIDRKLEQLVEKVKENKVHTIDSYFILGMQDKIKAEQTLSFAEVTALEQLYNTLHP
jgi:hypothetical protein